MTAKIFRSTLAVALVVLLCSVAVIIGISYDYFDAMQRRQLRDELRLAAAGTEKLGLDFLEGTNPGRYRITWVDPEGGVLYDTRADQTAMENHLDREEIRQALQEGSGSAVRYSATMTEKTVYEAVRLRDGSVLRLSASTATTASLLLGMLQPICVILFIAIVLSAVLSHRMAKRIVEPLNCLDLDHPLQNDAYEELSPMLDKLARQHLQIDSQLKTLRWKTEEFQHITRSMREGLVLLDGSGLVLSINPAAKGLLQAGEFAIGKDFLAIEEDTEVRGAVNRAYLEGSGECLLNRDGRHYRLSAQRIASEGEYGGVVVLTQDVTGQLQAQTARQELSAVKAGDADMLFTRLWTRKESYGKYTGRGICYDMPSFPVREGALEDGSFCQSHVLEDFVISVTAAEPQRLIRLDAAELPERCRLLEKR